MKATRNLFLVLGTTDVVTRVLNELNFKGMITVPVGTSVDDDFLEEVFSKNKSVVCYGNDYTCFQERVRSGLKEKEFIIFALPTEQYDVSPSIAVESDRSISEQFAQIADEYGCNIGDPKSNSSNGEGPSIDSCAYCRYQNGDPGGNDRTIYKSKSFFVLATIGQFVTGYLLIIPRRHIMSNAELTDEEMAEFYTVLEDVEYLIKITYSTDMILVWENGSGKSGKSKAKDSVVHSHVHVVPSTLTAEEVEETSGLPFERITLDDLKDYASVPYLLMRSEADHDTWMICPSKDIFIPRQWIRNLVAEKVGITDDTWNWRVYPFAEKMRLTVDQIRTALLDNWNTVPERIKENVKFLF